MKKLLKILIVEDNLLDSELIENLLKKEKLHFESLVVSNREMFLIALGQFHPNIILADNSLPQFSAMEALNLLKNLGYIIPFIMVTGTVPEEFATGIIKAGADDYILKDRLSRLPAAIDSALKRHKAEIDKKMAVDDLRRSEEKYRTLIERVSDSFFAFDNNWCFTYLNKHAGKLVQRDPETLIGKNVWEEFPDVVGSSTYIALNKAMDEQQYVTNIDYNAALNLWQENHIYPSVDGLSVFVKNISEKIKHEEEEKKEHNLLRTVIDNLPDYIYVKDQDSKLIMANRALIDLIGVASEKEIHGKTLLNFSGIKFDPMNSEEDANIISSGESIFNRDEPITTRSGDQRWLLTTKVPFRDDENLIEGLIGISRDITNRKKSEKELQVTHDRLSFVIKNSPLGFIEWDKDVTVKSWSKQAEFIFGWKDHDPKSRNGLARVYEADLPFVSPFLKRMISGELEKLSIQHRNYTQDGKVIWCEWFNLALKDAQGDVNTILSLVQDITERKLAEDNVIRSERRLNEAQSIAQVGSWEVDFTENTHRWSDELYRIYGIKRSEVEASTELFLSFMHHHDIDTARQKVQQAFDLRKGSSFNFRFIRNDGTVRCGYTEWKYEFDKSGKPLRLYGIIQDITERKEAEEELKQINEELRDLSSHLQNVREEERIQIARDIHDDLGQQLTGLKMDVTWLNKKMTTIEPDAREKMAGMIQLIDETVKSVRRISSNLRPSILDDLGLIAALEWHSEEVQKRFEIKVNFKAEVEEPDIPLATATGIFRIYQEVLTNAVRHANAQVISATFYLENEYLILKIKDDGKGMDKVEIVTKKTLGLIGIKERTFVMGGKYDLKSEPGEGTQIKISIPYQNKKLA